jgi:arginine kinase
MSQDRLRVESLAVCALGALSGPLGGQYYSLGAMSEAEAQRLISDHFLFKKGDRSNEPPRL